MSAKGLDVYRIAANKEQLIYIPSSWYNIEKVCDGNTLVYGIRKLYCWDTDEGIKNYSKATKILSCSGQSTAKMDTSCARFKSKVIV